MPSRLLKLVSICAALLLSQACSHPIEIVGRGDVTSTGSRGCTYEESRALPVPDKCAKNLIIGDYQETYYATPRDGWTFDHWGNNYCPDAAPPNYECSFNVPAAAVQQFWGQTMPPLQAVFTPLPQSSNITVNRAYRSTGAAASAGEVGCFDSLCKSSFENEQTPLILMGEWLSEVEGLGEWIGAYATAAAGADVDMDSFVTPVFIQASASTYGSGVAHSGRIPGGPPYFYQQSRITYNGNSTFDYVFTPKVNMYYRIFARANALVDGAETINSSNTAKVQLTTTNFNVTTIVYSTDDTILYTPPVYGQLIANRTYYLYATSYMAGQCASPYGEGLCGGTRENSWELELVLSVNPIPAY